MGIRISCTAGGLVFALFLAGAAQAQDNRSSAGSGETTAASAESSAPTGDPAPLDELGKQAAEISRSLDAIAAPAGEAMGTKSRSRSGEASRAAPATDIDAEAGLASGGATSPDSGEGERSVFGRDTRERVTDTGAYPFRTVGVVQFASVQGSRHSCTGALIGPRTVLTSAHCIWDVNSNDWYDDFIFAPGANAHTDFTFGYYEWDSVHIMEGYASGWTGDYNDVMAYDIGMIILDTPIGDDFGWLGFEYDPQPSPLTLNHIGHPYDKQPQGSQWRTDCDVSVNQFYDYAIGHLCDTDAGGTGGPLYVFYEDGSRMIRGIEVFPGEQSNFALRLNDYHFEWIMANRE